jgi:hypothetical protein
MKIKRKEVRSILQHLNGLRNLAGKPFALFVMNNISELSAEQQKTMEYAISMSPSEELTKEYLDKKRSLMQQYCEKDAKGAPVNTGNQNNPMIRIKPEFMDVYKSDDEKLDLEYASVKKVIDDFEAMMTEYDEQEVELRLGTIHWNEVAPGINANQLEPLKKWGMVRMMPL